jgi:hypothetical protein
MQGGDGNLRDKESTAFYLSTARSKQLDFLGETVPLLSHFQAAHLIIYDQNNNE